MDYFLLNVWFNSADVIPLNRKCVQPFIIICHRTGLFIEWIMSLTVERYNTILR